MCLLEIEHLRKVYPGSTPISDLSLKVDEGEVISIIGPSGTGKSTLLRCINRLVQPTSGRVIFDGTEITDANCDIASVRRKMGMVFQQFNLFANRSILENVIEAPIRLRKVPAEEARTEGMALLRRIGLADKADNYPDELSGGQQQRVAIARAVAMKPRILLFDEPTSALDPAMVAEVLGLIRALARDGMTMLIVTHEMRFARDVSTRILYMDEGGIYEDGTPEQIFEHPVREKTRRFIRQLRVLPLTIDSTKPFDFLGALSTIDRFGVENMLPPVKTRHVQLIFEELVLQSIVPRLDRRGDGYPVEAVVEYSEADGKLSMSVKYGGGPFNPLSDALSLPAKVVTGIAAHAEYRYADGNGLRIEV